MIDIKRAIKGSAKIMYARDGALWYCTEHNEPFPVPFADVTAEFRAVEPGVMLMRWMRKYNESLKVEPVV